MTAPIASVLDVPHGRDKTALLQSRALEGALDDRIRNLAVQLITGLRSDEHRERLARIHRFVSLLPYYREPIETFHDVWQTAEIGGDCDDRAALTAALAWALRYPFHLMLAGDPNEPDHYYAILGEPHADHPTGDENTIWHTSETSIPAPLGMHWSRAR